MLDNIREIFEIFMLGLLVVVALLVTRLLILNKSFARYFSNKKYRLQSLDEFEPLSKTESFSIHVFNNNLTDARITGVGFIYKHQTIDYYKAYLKQINTPLDGKIMIPTRDSIKIHVNIQPLLDIISDANAGKNRVRKLECFVTDSLGLTTTIKAKTIRKVIKRKLRSLSKQAKRTHKENIRQQKAEKRTIRRKKRALRKTKRQVSRERFKLWLKARISKLRRKQRK